MWKRARKRFSLTRGRGHDGSIREVLQEDSRSIVYRVYDDVTYVEKKRELRCHVSPALYLLMFDYDTYDYSMFAFSYSPY
jgi:hypothetical protein